MEELPHVPECGNRGKSSNVGVSNIGWSEICSRRRDTLLLGGVSFVAGSFLLAFGSFIVDISKDPSGVPDAMDRVRMTQFEMLKMITFFSGGAIATCGVGFLSYAFKQSLLFISVRVDEGGG